MEIPEARLSNAVVYIDADIEDLVPRFLQNRRRDVETMLEACGQSDYEAVRILGHNMKGVGAGYGFDLITEIGQFLERGAIERDLETVLKLVGDLSSYLDGVEVVIV